MMKKILVSITFILVLFLASCSDDVNVYNFKIRKDDYFVSENGSILVEYKTNEDGKLVNISIDRLLPFEDMIYFNPLIDYNYSPSGFFGDVFTDSGYDCSKYINLRVPINIEIGSTRFKYERTDCEYQEVDRNNIIKTGTYARKYSLRDTLEFSTDTIISIVVFDANSIEKFIEVIDLPNSVKTIGVYSIGFNDDLDGFSSSLVNYYKEMAVYEQLLLKLQENDLAVSEISGFSEDINILDLGSLDDITPLIKDFDTTYLEEIKAINELVDLIGVIKEEDTEDEIPEDDEEIPEGEETT